MSQRVALVLSGGVALGAYQAGAYSELERHPKLRPELLLGSSIGAVNAAVIAGSPEGKRTECLRRLWDAVALAQPPFERFAFWAGGRRAWNWASVLQARLFGVSNAFRVRLLEMALENVTSFYDLGPLRRTLAELVDFDRLNRGDIPLAISATDIETGKEVVFDTRRGDRIGPEHIVASCGFLPDFAPVEIGGRLLGDGCLATNAPIGTALLDEAADGRDLVCFVVDLFSSEGRRPATIEEAATRRVELLFGNQSRQRLEWLEREFRLRKLLREAAAQLEGDSPVRREIDAAVKERGPNAISIYHLCHRPFQNEAGPERQFDFSRATLADRWQAGLMDMAEAARRAETEGPPREGLAIRRIARANSRGRSEIAAREFEPFSFNL